MEAGIGWFGGQFFFEDMSRWQLWFDNPNKAATFLVEISVIGLILGTSKRLWKSVVGLILFLVSSAALVYTFSRGGFVAWVMLSVFLLWKHIREHGCGLRFSMIFMAMILVVATSLSVGLSRRMMHGVSGSDMSVNNRIEVWSAAPKMLWDAPLGWGFGNSGKAYVDWYQPLHRDEQYRTLVNSHLTWMVETGWLGSFAWVLGWSVLLFGAYKIGCDSGSWMCFAEWLCLFITGAISSVMECPWLWIIPVTAFLLEVKKGPKVFWGYLTSAFSLGTVLALLVVVLTLGCAWLSERRVFVSKKGKVVSSNGIGSVCWVVSDELALGGVHFPRVLRSAKAESVLVPFNIVQDASFIPSEAEFVMFCGDAEAKGRKGRQQTIWLSPSSAEGITAEDVVITGEFSAFTEAVCGAKVVVVPGVSDFIPTWPIVVSKIIKAKQCVAR